MPEQPTLLTQRLLLRPFHPTDAAAVHEIVSDREIAANTLHIPHPYPEGMAAEWIGSQEPKWEKGDGVVFAAVLREGGALVAAVGLELEPPHRRGELGYWVARPHWDRGYATEASRAVVRFGFAELGLNRVQARHYSRNPSSGAVMRKLGMRWEGRLRQHVYKWGTYEDLEIYGILREELLDGDGDGPVGHGFPRFLIRRVNRTRVFSSRAGRISPFATNAGIEIDPVTETLPSGGAAHLECTRCGRTYDAEAPHRLSPCCEKPLYPRYDLEGIGRRLRREDLAGRSADLWRYAELLPVRDPAHAVRLGEGWTPLIDTPRLAARLGMEQVWIKDEGQNPTASFKARGLCLAVSRAKELGINEVALPSAGNAGSATAAYAAAAGMRAHVVVPRDTPAPIVEEMRALGAEVELLDGLITDCAVRVAQGAREHGWFDLSTLKEPYRVEGKKTMGYELAEQLGWTLPDVIVYPTGGGTGLVGMWKAFDEMERMGWIGADRPRMVSVQAAGCAPIVRAWREGSDSAAPWEGAHTYASGLRVPRAVGDFLMLQAIRESGGAAVEVEDDEMRRWTPLVGGDTGIFCAPEGAATAAAVSRLLADGTLRSDESVVLFNTGSGLKYVGM